MLLTTNNRVKTNRQHFFSTKEYLSYTEVYKEYLGKRILRGLFQSSIGKLINADVNGALNILRKSVAKGSSTYITL